MSREHKFFLKLKAVVLVMIMAMSMGAEAGFLGFGGDSWKEEVLLHDGSKIIVKRTVKRGGRHEIGQKPAYSYQRLTFTMPGTNEEITWEDNFSKELGSANFLPMLLDLSDGIAYLVVDPMGCLSYNKWGRPNPPYVVFRYQGNEWRRIPLEELPAGIVRPNLIISSPDEEVEESGKNFITVEMIKNMNEGFRQPQYKTILRESLPDSSLCPDWSSERYRSPKAPLPMKPITEK